LALVIKTHHIERFSQGDIMSCLLCKCPYCGCIIGLQKDSHELVFHPRKGDRSEPGSKQTEASEKDQCPHLVYAIWRIEHWELTRDRSPQVGFGVNGDWRCPKLIAADDEHPSAYLEDELSDLLMAGVDEVLGAVAPHQVEQGRRTIERLLTPEEKAHEPPHSDREFTVDFVAQLQCVFAVNVDRLLSYLTRRSYTDLSWIPQRSAMQIG
jgi:hypothetical protein